MMLTAATALAEGSATIVGASLVLLVSLSIIRHALRVNPLATTTIASRLRRILQLERLGLGGVASALFALLSIWTILTAVIRLVF